MMRRKLFANQLLIFFARVLEDAGVYKTNSEGLDQFKAFVDFVNLAD